MGKIRGFLLKHRVNIFFRRVFGRRCSPFSYRRLDTRVKPFSRLATWTNRLRTKARAILHSSRGYIRVGEEPVLGKPGSVPKGHMAVYVGQKDGDFERIMVPVVYLNHPLFGDLLKESEKEYGFRHPGGITIPCRVSEFERVQTRIESVHCTRKSLPWKKTGRSFRMS
ncbi:hypothetical protein CASFOL_005854 [Castilleja foliolosa]|uniref:Small auxin up regulated protein n=1 Tax=Castilleja foliolosa TaxID=1961234 RepID=A0ABD3E8P4_9LAMI